MYASLTMHQPLKHTYFLSLADDKLFQNPMPGVDQNVSQNKQVTFKVA